MTGEVVGLAGAGFGLASAVVAIVVEHTRRARAGEPVTWSEGLGFGAARRHNSVERYVLVRAAALSFLVLLVASATYGVFHAAFGWSQSGWVAVWGVWGVGGAAFGVACAVLGRRTA